MNGATFEYTVYYEETDALGEISVKQFETTFTDPAQANRKFDVKLNPTKNNRRVMAIVQKGFVIPSKA